MAKGFELDHTTGDVVTELFHLFPDVKQKGVARPATYHHNNINWALSE